MNTTQNFLEECSKASKQYAALMMQYKDFFNCLLTNPLQAFGYERWTANNIYCGLSNMPAIAELFLETAAFEDQNVIARPKNTSSFCTFIYPDAKIYNPKYNAFRNSLERHLQIRISFCIIKRHINYCEAFVWNFKKPSISLQEEKRVIINDFFKNSALINACIHQFKKNITLLLPTEAFGGIDISQQSPLYTNNKNPAEHVGDYSQYIELLYYAKTLEREKLSFSDFGLSQAEQEAISLFLKTPDSGRYFSENLNKISLKLQSLKHIIGFENEYNELQTIGLTR
jgi:hypothetical protein